MKQTAETCYKNKQKTQPKNQFYIVFILELEPNPNRNQISMIWTQTSKIWL